MTEKFEFWKEFKTKSEAKEARERLPDWKEGKIVKVKDKLYPYQLWIREKPRKKGR